MGCEEDSIKGCLVIKLAYQGFLPRSDAMTSANGLTPASGGLTMRLMAKGWPPSERPINGQALPSAYDVSRRTGCTDWFMADYSGSVFDFRFSRPCKVRERSSAASSMFCRLRFCARFNRDHRADFISCFTHHANRALVDACTPWLDIILSAKDSREPLGWVLPCPITSLRQAWSPICQPGLISYTLNEPRNPLPL